MPSITETVETGAFLPRAAASGEPLQLAMQRLLLTGRILPVGAHLLVSHSFRSAEAGNIEVIYSFVLPRDASLRRFEVTGENFAVRSALKPAKEAAETYEKGLAEGHLATLARPYRDGLVNLTVGNLRSGEEVKVTLEILAGVELRDDGLRFRFPFTLAPSYHSQARAAEVSPGTGELELPADLFGDLILPAFKESAKDLHQISFDLALEVPWDVEEIASPSHSVRVGKMNRVSLAPVSDLPNRDLVLDVRTGAPDFRCLIGEGGDGRRHFAAVIPSTAFGAPVEGPRTLVLLLDRSGSMGGIPISQARKAAAACLSALGPEDRFGLVAFDDVCELFRDQLSGATPQNREAAKQFLNHIDARGGTELAAGIKQATSLLGLGGDVFILTDGQVFGTEDIIETARPTGCRLHTLGIGSASQDRFLALLARETHGVSRFVTPRERVDQAALELFASVSQPLATGLKIAAATPADTAVSPDPPHTVFLGTPVLLLGDCASAASSIVIDYSTNGKARSLEVPLGAADNACGETLRLIRGSRLITDIEARLGAGEGADSEREAGRWEEYLKRLSEKYSLASRAMALVAVVERAGDRPGEPPRTRVVSVGLPEDMRFDGVFGSPQVSTRGIRLMRYSARPALSQAHYSLSDMEDGNGASEGGGPPEEDFEARDVVMQSMEYEREPEPAAQPTRFDSLVELSIQAQADGGLPGGTTELRILASLLALLAFVAHGSDIHSGPFRMHVKRLLEFLDRNLPGPLPSGQAKAADRARLAARAGRPLDGDWLALASDVSQEAHGAALRAWPALLAATSVET